MKKILGKIMMRMKNKKFPNLEGEVLHIKALINVYFKEDSIKRIFFERSIYYLNRSYSLLDGSMSPMEVQRDCLDIVSRKLLQEATIYYSNNRKKD